MIPKAQAPYDARDAQQFRRSLLARRPGYIAAEQEPFGKGAGAALASVVARYLQTIVQRFNQAPDKNKLAFLDFIGLELVAAQAARAPIVFQVSEQAADSRAPERTQVLAPPPPERTGQIVFETERATGIAAAKITEVFSLWPGRDQYIDHSTAFLASQPFQLFQKFKLKNTPHVIYVAHDTLLAFAGDAQIDVQFELLQPSGEPLEILWEYWDGKVWRRFKTINRACLETEEEPLDGTNGLTRSGTLHLQTDCAETAKTKVNEREGYWIRGCVTEQLLPASQKRIAGGPKPDCCQTQSGSDGILLPLVDNLLIGTSINRPLSASLTSTTKVGDGSGLVTVGATNEAGQPLNDDPLGDPRISSIELRGARVGPQTDPNPDGRYHFNPADYPAAFTVSVAYADLVATSAPVPAGDSSKRLDIDVALKVRGLTPDLAFADGASLDLSKPFFPFGQQPQPGAIFYFNHKELFSKPNAQARIYMSRSKSPQDELQVTETSSTVASTAHGGGGSSVAAAYIPKNQSLLHQVAWEYWNGREWAPLNISNPVADFDRTEIVDLIVPPDMAKIKINDQEELWMRVRLVSGGFGFKQEVNWTDSDSGNPNKLTYVVHKGPVVSNFLIGYLWQSGFSPAEQVLTYNDFQFEDRTFEARWAGSNFLPFRQVADTTPAVYLGFSKKLPVDRLGIFLEMVEMRGDTLGPALVWEYWNGSEWRVVSVEDETRNLRLPGILSFIGAEQSKSLKRFGKDLHWMRGRLKEDGPPGEPTVNGIFMNAVWASQQQTFNDVALGASVGLPDQAFVITQTPINPGERIEVRELFGARANVEWRILARELEPGDAEIIDAIERELGREDLIGDIVNGDLRLVRDRNKRVAEAWVRWLEQPHLFFSKPDDRHYVIDRALGRVYFGNGVKGRIPPPGAAILAKQFRAGGGLAGNVASRKITQLQGSVAGVEAVFNPIAASGGADGETIEAFGDRAPQSIHHRGRAVAPADYKTLAHEASADIAVAHALPNRNASGRLAAGWVTLIIIPYSKERRPWPSYGLRQKVLQFIGARGLADVIASDHLYITGPYYLPIDVDVTVAPIDPAGAGAVEDSVRAALEDFLHPLRGGTTRSGWEPGRDVYLSDVAAVLERVPGVDHVEELALLLEGTPRGTRVSVPDDRIAVAGEFRINLKAADK
jgi:Baseplate J-like protein